MITFDDLDQLSAKGADAIQRVHDATWTPDSVKGLRHFSFNEWGAILGKTPAYLRTLPQRITGLAPQPVNGRESGLSVNDVNRVRQELGRNEPSYLTSRDLGSETSRVVAVCNFKGGVGKSTLAMHLGHRAALDGANVLFVDADSQASLTEGCGISPDFDLRPEDTLFGAMHHSIKTPVADLIRKTNWPNIDIIPANLGLYDIELTAPKRLGQSPDYQYWDLAGPTFMEVINIKKRREAGLKAYDLVIVDCPPSLSIVTINMIFLAHGLIVPCAPNANDLASTTRFFAMLSENMGALKTLRGVDHNFEFLRLVATKYDTRDRNADVVWHWMRAIFKDWLISKPHTMSQAVTNAALSFQSLYEVPPRDLDRRTYQRAHENFEEVYAELRPFLMDRATTSKDGRMHLPGDEVKDADVNKHYAA